MGLDTERFPMVEAYRTLDTSPDGEIGRALLGAVDGEAPEDKLTLTAKGEAWASHLTPAMNSWFKSKIVAARNEAIAEATRAAERIPVSDNGGGFVREERLDAIEREKERRLTEVARKFDQNNKETLEDLSRRRAEYNHLRAREGGRDAKNPNYLLEWVVLLPLILIPEARINFGSFRSLPGVDSDAMALALTILVGVAIAAAAFSIGKFVRQLNYYFAADNHQRLRSGLWMPIGGAVLLIIVLVFIGYARYQDLQSQMQDIILLGGSPPNIVAQVAGILGANLIPFVLGGGVTAFLHDQNPDFTAKLRALRMVERKVERSRKSELTKQRAQIGRAAQERRQRAALNAEQMQSKPGYQDMRDAVTVIISKDAEVKALLEEYRSRLYSHLTQSGRHIRVYQRDPSADMTNPTREIKLHEFSALPIEFHWGEG